VKRANLLLGGGAALVIVGLVALGVIARRGDDRTPTTRSVVVATGTIAAGESGQDVLRSGRARLEAVDEDLIPADALGATTGLDGSIFTIAVAEGTPIGTSQLRTTSLGQGSIKIPKGQQAVALTVDFTAGGAGYVAPGDHVNLFVTVPANTPGATVSPYTKLLLSNVEVLDVSEELAPRRATPDDTAIAAPSQLTLLLALDAQQAEAAVFAVGQNRIWFTLAPEGAAPAETGGVTYDRNYLDTDGAGQGAAAAAGATP
jgi:pilus assembly protein CpaB